MSRRITAYSAASTWGWLRWFVYGGLIAAALWIGGLMHAGAALDHLAAAGAGILAAGVLALAYPRCPRCRHHVFARAPDGGRRMFRPRQRCGKCNLDLTRYSPADPRARKE